MQAFIALFLTSLSLTFNTSLKKRKKDKHTKYHKTQKTWFVDFVNRVISWF